MDRLPLGAHLATPRWGYQHHGIYAGNGRVVHYPGFKELFRRGRVEEVSLEEFTLGRGWHVRSWPSAKFSGLERIERARTRLGENSYRFWSNNCEHFAEWCASGSRRSGQIERFKTQVLGVMALIVFGPVVSMLMLPVVFTYVDDAKRWLKPLGHIRRLADGH